MGGQPLMSNLTFDKIRSQKSAIETLTRALRSGRVHHAYRFEGPDGVGKEQAAFALAQALVCEKGEVFGCNACSACRRAVTLADEDPRVPKHPDVVLIQRGLYPPQSLGSTNREATGIGVHQIRRIVVGRAGYGAHEGRALVFLIRDADELTIQAANALLKVLEEPPPRTHFVLMTSRPHRLLDTILSRTLAVRFGPLPDDVIEEILRERGLDVSGARLARGSASHALALGDAEAREAREAFEATMRAAIEAPDLAPAIAIGSAIKDRATLHTRLSDFAQSVSLLGRDRVSSDARAAEVAARQHAEIELALQSLEANAQPAFVVEALVARLRRA